MTDLVGRWDVLFVLGLFALLAPWVFVLVQHFGTPQKKKRMDPTRFAQVRKLCDDPPPLRKRYGKADARWSPAERRTKG